MAVQTIQEPPSEEKKRERKRKRQRWIQKNGREEHSLVKIKHRTRSGGQKKIVLGGSKENEARKGFSKGNGGFQEGGFRTYQPERVQAMISTRTKAEARTKKERARKVLICNLDFQPRKHPVKKDMAIPGNQTIGIPA